MKRLPDPVPACPYCGAPIREGRTCSAHRDLEQLDPALLAEGRPATEHALGVRSSLKVPKRAGREELY